jgi:arginyl-tRNA synthetase
MKIKQQLNQIIQQAFDNANIDEKPISVTEATKAEFGDYQFNGAMALAKKLKSNPREIAQKIIDVMPQNTMIAKTQIAGSGFINIWLEDSVLSQSLQQALEDSRLGIKPKDNPIKVVVDYSGPNMAKQMHVGHLRSTIIGDSLANLLEFLGYEVIRQNHIGDWGTQFGMLIAYLEHIDEDGNVSLKDLEQFYKDAKAKFDSDKDFANKAREYVVKIQSGDSHCIGLWEKFINISLGHCQEVYDKLNVNLSDKDVKAESFYNDDLSKVIDELDGSSMLTLSDGAKCVFLDGDDIPVIVQKADGGYLYATTDLAALRYRAKVLGAKRISYIVDARQSQHFKQVFAIAKKCGFVPQDVKLEHIAFGTMMDKSGKPFKTRDGGTVKLIDLLDEAIIKAKNAITNRDGFSQEELDKVAKIVGIGAVKYADLSINRESNYIFDWDKMLSFDGNTALYMQYAYARIQSIFRKYNKEVNGEVIIGDELEHKLALTLLKFEDTLQIVAQNATPNILTNYLYDLATLFMKFYENNPILKDSVDEPTRQSRLQLANMTAKTIKKGLDILGIEVVDRL